MHHFSRLLRNTVVVVLHLNQCKSFKEGSSYSTKCFLLHSKLVVATVWRDYMWLIASVAPNGEPTAVASWKNKIGWLECDGLDAYPVNF